jgi:uncharacterized RDD family membrane protein YckC
MENIEESEEITPEYNEDLFPSLLTRFQSVAIDGLVTIGLMFLCAFIFGNSSEDGIIKGIALVFIWLVYEPLFTSLGCTLGQWVTGVRVRKNNNFDQRINIFQAYFRIGVKGILGFISFFTVHSNSHRRAIHDYASGSVVISIRTQND